MTTTITGATGIDNIKAATGAVLQVVQGVLTQSGGGTVTSSTSYVTTGITATITPTSTSSKILITISSNYDTEAAGRQPAWTIYRGSAQLSGATGFGNGYSAGSRLITSFLINFLDTPTTTSATTYTLYGKTFDTSAVEFNTQGITSTIVLQEIAG
jgi:hypothetical protein